MSDILFTPAAVLDFLSQIDELNDCELGLIENPDNTYTYIIGNSEYEIVDDIVTEVPADQITIDVIDDINSETYEDLGLEDDLYLEPVNSGVLKTIVKTLLIGGLVKLTSKLLK